jgi:ectoine hydroxylase-related dioxygenase (phytanoyl-CoA dioxygenase family)
LRADSGKETGVTETERAIQEIEVYGFTVLEGVLSPEEVAATKEVLIRCEREFGEEHKHGGSARHVSNLPVLDPVFLPIIDHPRTLPILEQFLGKSLILGSLNSRIVRPGDGDQRLHGDIPAEMLNMASPVMMNTVWMLDDFTRENGATRVVPGTHRSGHASPPEGLELKYVVQAEAPAGSVLVFNGQCWHGGGENRSSRNRHALFGHYRKFMLLFQLDPHDGFPPEQFDRLTPRQKELLRMKKGLGVPHAADFHFR